MVLRLVDAGHELVEILPFCHYVPVGCAKEMEEGGCGDWMGV